MDTREQHIFRAKLSEQSERFDDMVEAMKEVVFQEKELSVEERNMLSVAFKNVIGSRRTSWRILSAIETREQAKLESVSEDDPQLTLKRAQLEQTQGYRKRVEGELDKICNEIIDLLDKHLIPRSESCECKVFYLKMKGDYFRYRAEFASGDEKTAIAEKSCSAYTEASEQAEGLTPTQPIRLGLALNFSVFYYEIMNKCDKACELATDAFDKAMKDMDNLSNDENYKDSTLIMQLLRDNLTLWRSSDDEPEAQDGN